jgi:hypothetical protein
MSLPHESVNLAELKALVQALVGESVQVYWNTEALRQDGGSGLDANAYPLPPVPPATSAAGQGQAVRVTLDIPSLTTYAMDENVREMNDVTELLEITQWGFRLFTLSVKVESEFIPDAFTVAERLRARFSFVSTGQSLRDIRCALREVSELRSLAIAQWDTRAVNVVQFDVWLTFAMSAPDDIGEGPSPMGNWIETVELVNMIDSPVATLQSSIRWDVFTKSGSYDQTFVLAMANSVSSSSPRHSFTFDTGSDKYAGIWFPDSVGPIQFKWGGDVVYLDVVATLTVVDVSATVTGKLYRTNIGLGNLTIESYAAP